jgi:hypothetical protein
MKKVLRISLVLGIAVGALSGCQNSGGIQGFLDFNDRFQRLSQSQSDLLDAAANLMSLFGQRSVAAAQQCVTPTNQCLIADRASSGASCTCFTTDGPEVGAVR